MRDPALRAGFARLPIEARRRLAAEAREGSREHLANAAGYITDVNAGAVASVFRGAGVDLLIHGHTHRPGVHRLPLDGSERTRVVLGAWHDAADVVRWDDAGWQLCPAPRESDSRGLGGAGGRYRTDTTRVPAGRGPKRASVRSSERAKEPRPAGMRTESAR